jgi:NRPS condensation-like uncharacterized protein
VSEYVAPRNEIEKKLCEIWEKVLHLDKVGIFDNFFKIGGHSLLAIKIISRIRTELGSEVPLKFLFEHPTISIFAKDIENSGKGKDLPPLIVQRRPNLVPLSFAQQRLWIIDKLLPQKAVYNIPFTVRLKGILDLKNLEDAVNRLIGRHESFRTNFEETDMGESYQIISNWEFRLKPEPVEEKDLDRLLQEESEAPFNLRKDHLLRIKLFKLAEEDFILAVTMHHIISDGWSMPIFWNELVRFYEDPKEELIKLPISYVDYAIWQRNWLKGKILEEQLNFWIKHLTGIPDYLELPLDYQRPSELTYEGDRYEFDISKETYSEVLKLANETNTTVFMVIFTAVSCLLHKYTHQEDIVLGTPVANRHYRETEGIIGFFVNTLALRIHFEHTYKFKDVLKEVKEAVLSGSENQDIPFEYLVDKLHVERRLNVNPLFQVMVTTYKNEFQETFKGIESKEVRGRYAVSKFDFEVLAEELEDHLHISLEYSTELFRIETIQRISQGLQNILNKIFSKEPLYQWDITSADERERQLMLWNATETEYPRESSIQELFEEQVEKTPDSTAVVHGDRWLSYEELNRRSNKVAYYLRGEGVRADVLVGLSTERSLDMVIGMLGIIKAGGAYVPLDPTYPEERLQYILKDSKAEILLLQRQWSERFQGSQARKIFLDDIGEGCGENPKLINSPESLAYVIYTSGSTGKPKGVQIFHQGVINHLCSKIRTLSITRDDIVAQIARQSFDISVWQNLAAIISLLTV